MNLPLQNAPECIATFLAYAMIIQGTITSLAPTLTLRNYGGIDEKDSSSNQMTLCKSNEMILRKSGYKGLNIGIYIFCLITKGYDMKIPLVFNELIWVAEILSQSKIEDDCT